MKKREFFQYKCGTKLAKEKLDGVFDELTIFEEQSKISDSTLINSDNQTLLTKLSRILRPSKSLSTT